MLGLLFFIGIPLLNRCNRLKEPPPPGVPDKALKKRDTRLWRYEKDGIRKDFYEDGSLALNGRYNSKGRYGVWKTYIRDSGAVASVGHYKKDWRDGIWKFNDDLGRLYLDVEYREEPKREFIFLITHDYGNENGPYHRYYPDGSLEEEGVFQAGYYQGPVVHYYRDGKKAFEGIFQKDKRNGRWTFYYPNGKLERVAMYKNGELDGTLQVYHPDGRPYHKSEYVKDKRIKLEMQNPLE